MRYLRSVAALAAGLAAAVGALAPPALGAQAAASGSYAVLSGCGGTQTFAPWQDWHTYVPAIGGGFERASAAWSFHGGAAAVFGNESYHVHSTADSRSLSLPAGSSATVRIACIAMLQPRIRLFAMNAGAAASTLRVDVAYRDSMGRLHRDRLATLTAGAAWDPTESMVFLDPAAALATQTNGQIWITFTPQGSGGAWRIDDVYVDPYKMH